MADHVEIEPSPPDPTVAHEVPAGERGSLSIADRVVEKVASAAAREVDEVVARSTGWRKLAGARALPRTKATFSGRRSRIGVEIATPWPSSLAAVAAETRDHVRERVGSLTGVDLIAVDVTVAAVIHLPPESRKLR